MRGLVLVVVATVVGCAPSIETPADQQHASDRRDSIALERSLTRLPGAFDAHVTLTRSVEDPFSRMHRRGGLLAVLIVDARADVGRLSSTASALLTAAAPELAPPTVAIVTTGATSGRSAAARQSRATTVLAALLGAIAALAGAVAWRERVRLRA